MGYEDRQNIRRLVVCFWECKGGVCAAYLSVVLFASGEKCPSRAVGRTRTQCALFRPFDRRNGCPAREFF
jgi:hypothetical protein